MSTYYRTFPAITINSIEALSRKRHDFLIKRNNCGKPVISMKNKNRTRPNEYNWLHLEIDYETGLIIDFYRNGWSDPTEIIGLLENKFKVKFYSEYDRRYFYI
jgi:hypothetical protein